MEVWWCVVMVGLRASGFGVRPEWEHTNGLVLPKRYAGTRDVPCEVVGDPLRRQRGPALRGRQLWRVVGPLVLAVHLQLGLVGEEVDDGEALDDELRSLRVFARGLVVDLVVDAAGGGLEEGHGIVEEHGKETGRER